ncbi:MAG: hypothetical protein JWQ27_453 [Ferruginibacter sp.]|nr:hypothetical protein [Ferruginibacter sp.]
MKASFSGAFFMPLPFLKIAAASASQAYTS